MFSRKMFFIAVFILIGASLSRTGAADENAGTVLIPLGDLIKQDKILSGHSGDVTSVTFSPDGKTLASGGGGPSIILWDVTTGNKIKTISEDDYMVTSVSFSPDGKTIASGSMNTTGRTKNTVILWDVATGKRMKIFSGHSNFVTSVTFSPDGKTLASGSRDETVILWDVATGSRIKTLSGYANSVNSVTFSPDGKTLASGCLGKVILWDVASGDMKTLSGRYSSGYSSVRSVSFSPDGKTLASGADTLILWDVATGKRMKIFSGHFDFATSVVTFSPDGKTLASGSVNKTIILWDVATGKRMNTLSGYFDDVTSVTFSLDGKTIATASSVRFPSVGNSIVILLDISIYKTWEDSNSLATAGLITERDDRIRKITSHKGEFESTREYEERMRAAEIEKERIKKEYEPRIKEAMDKAEAALNEKRAKLYPYSFNISLSKYDADREGFEVDILDNKIFIPMLREKAMEISKRKENFRVEGMLKYYDSEKAELVNAFIVDEQTNSRFAFGKQTDAVVTASAQKTPPDLKISSIALSEPSGNNILDADEIGKIKVVLKNNGKGVGFGVSLSLIPAPVLPKGIGFSEKTYIGTLNPGEEKTVEIEIAGGEEVQTSEVNMKATLTESNGFDSSPIILAFKTKELVPPLLQISKIDIEDSEGKRIIAKGKEINLTLSVQNAGSGPAKGVVAEIVSKNPDVKIFGDSRIVIGSLNPGEVKKAVLSIAVTQRYSGEKTLPVSFAVKEERERFSILPDIRLALNEEAPEIKVVTVAAREMPLVNVGAAADISVIPVLQPDQKVMGEHDIAVVIGIEQYQNIPKSEYSYNDAKLVRGYLRAMGFAERNIEYITNDKATLSSIKKSIESWLPNRAKKNSKIFVYYSGHGSPDPSTGAAYLVPFDGDPNYLSDTGYPLKRLYEVLGKTPAAEIVVVMDACFSGAGGRSVLARGARPALAKIEDPILASQNIAVLSSTQGTQISTSFPEKEHGLFTYHFLKAIKEGRKDLAEIYGYIKPIVEDEAKMLNVQQSPSINPDAEKLKGRFSLRK